MAQSDDLDGFVRTALEKGLPRERIRSVLVEAGWPESEVATALHGFAEVEFPLPVPRPRASLSAREAFEYVLLFGTLYFAAFNLGGLLFQFVDLAFPDPEWSQARVEGIYRGIRWSVAALVVAAPIFLLMARANARALAAAPVRRLSPIRRWLTYLTLAIAAGVLIGDVTTLVFRLLLGEGTAGFLLKALTVGAIAGAAFYYYLTDLRQDEAALAA